MEDGGGRTEAHIVRAHELSEDERRLWEDFRQADEALRSPFLSFGYVEAVAEVREGVRVCIIERDERVVAFFPYQLAGPLRAALRHGEPVGGSLTDAFGLIAATGFMTEPLALLRLARLSCLSFTHLLQAQARFGLTGTRTEAGLGIDLAAGPEGYWSDLRKTKRHFSDDTARRRSRIAAEVGPLRFQAEETEPLRLLESLIAKKIEQYRRTGAPNALAPSWSRDLLHILAQRRGVDCRATLSTLHAGDVWAASHFGLRSGRVLHWWFPVYDPELAPYAPGRLLLAAMIDASRALGVTRIDRGTGTQPAKRDFANMPQEFWRGAWWRPGARGMLARTELSLAWRLRTLAAAGHRIRSS
jgi:CelD/BcsL family acetyltransferase involved in cellulose biosynthesis